MAHDLLARLMHQSDDPVNYPDIGLHAFSSCIREYARKQSGGSGLTKAQIASNYSIDAGDMVGSAIVDLITNATDKLKKADEICDVLIIMEGRDSKALYPDRAAVAARLGV